MKYLVKKSKKNEKSVLTYWKTDDRISLVFERDKSADHYKDMERYRSGHNEAVLKTVCPKGRVGSNPTLSAFYGEVPKLAEGAPLERE